MVGLPSIVTMSFSIKTSYSPTAEASEQVEMFKVPTQLLFCPKAYNEVSTSVRKTGDTGMALTVIKSICSGSFMLPLMSCMLMIKRSDDSGSAKYSVV